MRIIFCFVDSLPGLNFAFHCGGGVTPEHPYLFRCTEIEEGIKSCQQNKKQVLLSLGGATGHAILGSKENAVKLANTLWQLFLGGNDVNKKNLRPFGS
jgi:chitinase